MARARYERVPSTCPHDCPSTCALEVERIDDRTIGRVYGAKDNSYTAGTLCAKVGRYAERVHHPDRLTVPLRRVGPKGQGRDAFRPISWEDALDTVAGALRQAAADFGPESVWPYFFAGTMGLIQRDSIQRLRHTMGYSQEHLTICTALVDNGWLAGTGIKRGVDPREMGEADLLVIWGGNPVNTQVNVMHHVTRARRERGAPLIVVDPYRTATAEKADVHLMLKPGTDAALACGVMHVLFRDGLADWDFLHRLTDCPEDLRQHLSTRDPAWAADITGLPEAQIVDFAHLYGRTARSFIRLGYGLSRSRNGAASVHAVSCLPAVTGAWRHRGGGALYSTRAVFELDQSLIMALDRANPAVRSLDQSRIGPVLCGNADDLQGGPPVKALFIQNTNPMAVCPDQTQVRAGFMRDDLFVCVHEHFLTETAAMADVVLPATMFVEHDDFYTPGGHTHLQVTRAVIKPPGECRSNHDVLCALAQRLGIDHPGFRMTAWELIDDCLRRSGYPDAPTLHNLRWLDCAQSFDDMHNLNGFGWPDGKFRFRPDWQAMGPHGAGMPSLPDYLDNVQRADAAHPFRMVTAPARNFLNSSFTEMPTSTRREGRPTVKLHPADAAPLGIGNGTRVRLGNDQGSVVVHAELFDGLQPGVIVVESVWPNAAFEEGRGINTLVSADPGWPNGGAVFHDVAVWLRAA
ncbi:MAG: molybdopterin oxidoreductase family protein [Pseudomonadota bacterium]